MTQRTPPAAPKVVPAVRFPFQWAWRLRNPDKTAAHQAVKKAIRAGTLVRGACEDADQGPCTSGPVEAHHPDYSQPLMVVWLCRGHHKRRHARRAKP